MQKWIVLLYCVANILSAQQDPLELIPSTPDEVAARLSDESTLIGGLISPLSGQLCLRTNDLTVLGAQNLEFGRVYLPPCFSASSPVKGEMEQYLQEKEFLLAMQKNFRGWVFLPHIYLERTTHLLTRLTDASGATLTFEHKSDGSQAKPTSLYGISNASQDQALGQFDMRNTRFSFDRDIKVFFPNGTTRIYKPLDGRIFLLEKEVLPNGKIIRYFFEGDRLKSIQSRDRTDTYTYASITLDGDVHRLPYELRDHPKKDQCGEIKNRDVGSVTYLTSEKNPEWIISQATGSTGDRAIYGNEPLNKDRILRKKCGTFEYHIAFPSPLKTASTPHYRSEEILNKDFQISDYSGRDHTFHCTYEHHRVKALFLPVGENDAMKPVYQMSYDPPLAGKKEGKTTVYRIDGSKIEYLISKELLLDAILSYDPQGKLKKEKKYHWDDHHRLQAVELKDGENTLLFKTAFEDYDAFGNPQTEKFIGDLRGQEKIEEYVVKKKYDQNRLIREENEEGRICVYEYFKDTSLLSAKYTQDGEKVILREFWIYDDSANLIEKIIDDGPAVTFKKITRYRLRQEQPFLHMPEWIEDWTSDGKEEQLAKKIHLSYDQRGHINLEEIYGSDNHFAYKITHEYDEQGNLVSETNPLNYTATSTYTPKGQLETTETFSHRLKAHKSYDAQGRLKRIEQNDLENKIKHETTYKYDLFNRCIKTIDYLGNSTLFDYDPISSEITKTEGPSLLSVDDQILAVKSLSTYDALGRKRTCTDANGHTTTYQYNAYGSPFKIIYPDGGVETYQYEKNGLLKFHTDPDHLVTEFTYDIQQRLIEKRYLFEGQEIASEHWTYDAFHLKTYTDKEGHTTTYAYDPAGRKYSETICGRTTTFDYDTLGRLKTIKQEQGQWVQMEKDALDQLLVEKTTDENGALYNLIKSTWDPDGNRTSITRFPHNKEATETFTYDPFKRMTEHRDALGFTTTTLYQENQHNQLGARVLTSLTSDPNGIVTRKCFDPYGRLSQKDIGSSYSQERFYDAVGNLLQMKEGALLNRYEYEPSRLLKSHTRAYGTNEARTTTYTHTKGGKLSTKTLPSRITLTYTYTPLGYLHTKTSSDGSLSEEFTYSLNGHMLSASGLDHSVKRDIDEFGNIRKEEIDGLCLTKTYDRRNRLKTITLPDQSSLLYEYDPTHLRSVTRFSSQNTPLYTHSYKDYDQAGNLLAEQLIYHLGQNDHTYNPTGTKNSIASPYFSQTIAYDPGSRVKDTSDGHYEYNELSEIILEQHDKASITYDYDPHYNRIQKNDQIIEHNLLDEPLGQSYDLNGNLKKHNQFNLEYDVLNRLIRAHKEDTDILFHYDPLDRCIAASVNGTQEFYLYHNLEELGSFYPNGSSKELKIPGLSGIPIAVEQQGQAFAPLCDYSGNIRCLIDPATTTSQTTHYTAFGEALTATPQPWGYSSKRLYKDLGLYNFGKRFYDPATGRWLTTDPAGQIDGTNLYTYLYNDPLNYTDPDGQYAFALLGLSWGGSAGAAASLPILSNPVGWVVGGVVLTALAVGWTTNKLVESNKISPTTGQTINSLMGISTSLINQLPVNDPFGISTIPVGSTGYGSSPILSRKKEGSVDPSLPTNPDELLKRPGWEETSHPDAGKRGHRTFENKATGEQLRHDQGKPGEPGHRGHDHYHRPNPNSTGPHNEYLDGRGNPVPDGHDHSHIYAPGNIWWK